MNSREGLLRFYMEQGLSQEEAEARVEADVESANRFLPELRKVATAKDLKKLNAIAVERGYNRAAADDFLKRLDPEGWNFCTVPFLHQHKMGVPCEPHVRGRWLCKMRFEDEPQAVFIDMDAGMYMGLPEYDPDTQTITKNPAPPGWADLPPLTNE